MRTSSATNALDVGITRSYAAPSLGFSNAHESNGTTDLLFQALLVTGSENTEKLATPSTSGADENRSDRPKQAARDESTLENEEPDDAVSQTVVLNPAIENTEIVAQPIVALPDVAIEQEPISGDADLAGEISPVPVTQPVNSSITVAASDVPTGPDGDLGQTQLSTDGIVESPNAEKLAGQSPSEQVAAIPALTTTETTAEVQGETVVADGEPTPNQEQGDHQQPHLPVQNATDQYGKRVATEESDGLATAPAVDEPAAEQINTLPDDDSQNELKWYQNSGSFPPTQSQQTAVLQGQTTSADLHAPQTPTTDGILPGQDSTASQAVEKPHSNGSSALEPSSIAQALAAPNAAPQTAAPQAATSAAANGPQPDANATQSIGTSARNPGITETQASRPVASAAKTGTAKAQDAPEVTQQERVRLVQRVARSFSRLGTEGGQLQLRLHPPQLGSLAVRVQIQGGSMSARLTAESEAAKEIIMEGLPMLRKRLADQGVEISQFQVDVSDGTSDTFTGGSPDQQTDLGERRESPWEEGRQSARRPKAPQNLAPRADTPRRIMTSYSIDVHA